MAPILPLYDYNDENLHANSEGSSGMSVTREPYTGNLGDIVTCSVDTSPPNTEER